MIKEKTTVLEECRQKIGALYLKKYQREIEERQVFTDFVDAYMDEYGVSQIEAHSVLKKVINKEATLQASAICPGWTFENYGSHCWSAVHHKEITVVHGYSAGQCVEGILARPHLAALCGK